MRRIMQVGAVALALACAPSGPDMIAYDVDVCAYCHMLISDPRFAAVLVTDHGRSVKFDSIECLRAYYAHLAQPASVVSIWVSDFQRPRTLIDAMRARFVDLGDGHAPMGRGWVAVTSPEAAQALGMRGDTKTWSELQ
jgi:copper chaperone NosL